MKKLYNFIRGGAILDKKIRKKIKSDSYCIYLKVKIDELIQDLKELLGDHCLKMLMLNRKLILSIKIEKYTTTKQISL